MSRFRKELLFLCDTLILVAVGVVLVPFSVRYTLGDLSTRWTLMSHMLLLYGCTVVFQVAFHTYDSLWRYAESREYLSLLMAALWGFFAYEVISRLVIREAVPFLLLTAIASVWVLGMLLVRFVYRVYRTHSMYQKGSHQIPVAIIGAGAAGVQLLGELQSNADSRYNVQCSASSMTTGARRASASTAWRSRAGSRTSPPACGPWTSVRSSWPSPPSARSGGMRF